MPIDPPARIRRSLLFTPANRPSAFEKGLASGADCLCLDLEDAVPPGEKDSARPDAVAFLTQSSDGPERVLRINALSTRFGLDDLSAVACAAPASGVLLLPKVASADELRLAAAILDEAGSDLRLAALIESALGLQAVGDIGAATPRLAFLLFGAIDLSADLGCARDSPTMTSAAGATIVAAKAADIDVFDAPDLAFHDLDEVAASARRARASGFTGKAAIHPSNVAPINTAFTPSADEVAEAMRIVAAYEGSPNGLAVLDGRLVEAPVVRTMRRRLALAQAAETLA